MSPMALVFKRPSLVNCEVPRTLGGGNGDLRSNVRATSKTAAAAAPAGAHFSQEGLPAAGRSGVSLDGRAPWTVAAVVPIRPDPCHA